MHPKYLALSVLLLAALLLAGCGGDDGDAGPLPTPTDTPLPTNTFTVFEAAPTWTPEPAATAVPRATIDYDYARPTSTFNALVQGTPLAETPGVTPPPGETTEGGQPTPAPPPTTAPVDGETPPNPTLSVAANAINMAIQDDPNNALRQLFTSVPAVSFENGQVVLTGNLRVTINDVPGAQPVRIIASVALLSGEPVLAPIEAVFTNDNTPYDGDILAVLDPLRTLIHEQIGEAYAALRPNDAGYFISRLTVGEGVLTVETLSLTE